MDGPFKEVDIVMIKGNYVLVLEIHTEGASRRLRHALE